MSSVTILIVDADLDCAHYIEQMLLLDSYVIKRVGSLALMERSVPDLIFCMPDSAGCKMTRALKAIPGGAQVPVIMLSEPDSDGGHRTRMAGLDSGAQAVLMMASDGVELRLVVRNLLRLKGVIGIAQSGIDPHPDSGPMALRLSRAREQERINLARELHDELGQRLMLLKIDLHHLRGFVQGVQGLKTWQDADEEVSMLTARVRAIAGSLRPPVLDFIGLEAALRQLLERQFAHGAAHCIFEYACMPATLGPGIDIAIYRIVQESVANIVRHADATRVVVELNAGAGGDEIELIIRDNGRGFDTAILHSAGREAAAGLIRGGIGLPGIKERIQLLGGLFFLESVPQQGTRIVVQLPLKLVLE